MEVVNANSLQLSNFEVLNLLKELKGQQKKNTQSQLATITYETTKYLEDKPCSKQSSENIQVFLKKLLDQGLQLSKAEKLMLINNPPTHELEIQLVVEESEERLSVEQVNEILDVTAETFNLEVKKVEKDSGEQAEEDEEAE